MRRFVASCSMCLAAVGLLAACGSSGSGTSGSNTIPLNDATSATTPTGSTDFAALASAVTKQKFKITYTAGSGDMQTYAQDGQGRSVYGTSDTQVFTSSSGSISCSMSEGKAECQELPGSDGSISPFINYSNAEKSYLGLLGGSFGHTGSKHIAGRAAECVSFSASDIGGAVAANLKGSLAYCLDKETGVLLRYDATNAAGKKTTVLQVTKFEEPSDSDFTPPATPVTSAGDSLPAGVTIPSAITLPTIPGGG